MKTAIFITTYNRVETLKLCLDKIKKIKKKEFFEIFILDNSSNDKTKNLIKIYDEFQYIKFKKNYYTSKAINKAFKYFNIDKDYKYLILLSDDVLVDDDSLITLVKFIDNNQKIGLAGPVIYDIKKKVPLSYGSYVSNITSILNNASSRHHKINHFDFCFILRTRLFKKIGYFNEILFPFIYEEPDLGNRIIRANYEIKCCPKAKIYHPIINKTIKSDQEMTGMNKFFANYRITYLFFRNRIIYMSLYSNLIFFLIFYLLINWIIFFYYLRFLKKNEIKFALLGIFDGIIFVLFKNKNYIKNKNHKILNI